MFVLTKHVLTSPLHLRRSNGKNVGFVVLGVCQNAIENRMLP